MKCKKKGCKEPARPLSYHDTPRVTSTSDPELNDFNRETVLKCEAGHISKERSVYKPKPLDNDKPLPETPKSKKRFHMKGFAGHKVNQVSKHFSKMRSDGFSRDGDGMNNHDRVLRQRAFKEKAAR